MKGVTKPILCFWQHLKAQFLLNCVVRKAKKEEKDHKSGASYTHSYVVFLSVTGDGQVVWWLH